MQVMINCVFVGLGGMLGAVARYLLGLIPVREMGGFPLITLGINILGALVIGLLAALAQKQAGLDAGLLLFLKVGLCGGFTTFSTFALEAQGLLSGGRWGMALLYVTLSVAGCIAAVALGRVLVR
ncbi:camphor resistance protein CrcB [uncultured Clostridium sp.]|nr:camphor resistance protein CrcB [uncultured Clostridium sp.]